VPAHALYMKAIHGGKNKNDIRMIRQYDEIIQELETEFLRVTRKIASRDYTLLQSIPGVGRSLGLTILYEIDTIERFPTVKDFSSFCRLVKGSVASTGKIKGSRGGKPGNPYLRWAFGEAAVIARRNHYLLHPYAQRLEAAHGKFKANAILANKVARAVCFMLKEKTLFNPEKLIALPSKNKMMA